MPTRVYFGRGAINTIPKILKTYKKSKVLFVVGKHTQKDQALKSLFSLGTIYSKDLKESDFKSVNDLSEYIISGSFDSIIAIGGGKVLDTTKAANVFAVNGEKAEDYLQTKIKIIKKKGIFLIAVPTTSGTGSEVTPFAVIWDNKKYSLTSDLIYPDIAIVDPALSDNCPPYVTATSGIDALCQAIEAYWNVHNNPISDKYALESIKTIIENLEHAVNNPSKQSRNNMAWGSLMGGLAFSNTATTICHSVSYPITAHFGIAHGQATSITLPMFIEYMFPVLSKNRISKILNAMKIRETKEAVYKIKKLMKSIGLKTKLSDLNIPRNAIDLIVSEGFDPERARNAPRIPVSSELNKMLLSIY